MNVIIAVTHLLGSGHLARAITLARAFAKAGHHVRIASGGMPAPQLDPAGLQVIQLPPLQSDGTNFTTLLDARGNPADASYLASRVRILTDEIETLHPDILITELFPFGRRVLAPEFLALLDATANLPRRPVTLASIRDILAPPSKPAKAARTDDIVARHYDAVLVHSDPAAAPLERSWPVSDRLRPFLHYTGYVAPPAAGAHPDGVGDGEVLVSAGGGPVGDALFRTAIDAARRMAGTRWRLLVGGSDATTRIAALKTCAAGVPATIEPARPDFRQMLNHAAASVSMCGYNTALDILQSGVPSVLVPFDAGNETEQTLRAHALAALPAIAVLTSATLTPDRMADTVARVIALGRRGAAGLQFDGAARSVEIACDLARARA